MLDLREFRSKPSGLPDYLNFGFMIKPGVMIGKNGSHTALFSYAGFDTEAMLDYEKDFITEQLNQRLKEFSENWMFQVDFIRRRSDKYSLSGSFPDPITQAIEDERRSLFEAGGHQFENSHNLYLSWLPPSLSKKKIESSITGVEQSLDKAMSDFEEKIDRFESDFQNYGIKRISTHKRATENGKEVIYDDFLSSLVETLSSDHSPIAVPSCPMYLDVQLVHHDLINEGRYLQYGDKKIAVISIDGFFNDSSYPLMFEALSQIDLEFRWNTRFVTLDRLSASSEIKKYRRKWSQQIIGFKDQLLNNTNARPNRDAANKASEADEALTQLNASDVAYGYYTSAIVITRDSLDILWRDLKHIDGVLRKTGIQTRIENLNLVEAWLGSLPSHSMYNLRRPLVNTRNLAHILPLTGVWRGTKYNPSPLFPLKSSALSMMLTRDGTSFNFNIHELDVAHTLVVGPTGSGKSYLLCLIEAQFARYEKAKVFVFDNQYSAFALAMASGKHFEVDPTSHFSLAPLKGLSSSGELLWAEAWICDILKLQGVELSQETKREVRNAVKLTASCETASLSFFYHHVTSIAIKEALKPYLSGGPLGSMLDSMNEEISDSWLQCFELSHLLKVGGETENDKYVLPVLSVIFRKIEESLDGSPAIIVIDEAWMAFRNPVFSSKVGNWLDTLRKANAGVILATTQVSHFLESSIKNEILSACKTKIFLPNPEAKSSGRAHYQQFGLNDIQIEMIAQAEPLCEYYFHSPSGSRLFQTGTGPLQKAFLGSVSHQYTKRIKELHKEYGAAWSGHWIRERC